MQCRGLERAEIGGAVRGRQEMELDGVAFRRITQVWAYV